MEKKNSSPLPQERKVIYDRGHINSKSWNPEVSFDVNGFYSSTVQPCAEDKYALYPPEFVPRICVPGTVQPMHGSSSRTFQRQAVSFDGRQERNSWVEKRSWSENERADRQGYLPQQADTSGYLPPHPRDTRVEMERKELSNPALHPQCQSLWAARDHLEQLRQLGIEDPSSASTSFESNTEAIAVASRDLPPDGTESALERRNKYKSLLLQRKFLPGGVSSVESTLSTDSPGGVDAPTVGSTDSAATEERRLHHLGSSMDSGLLRRSSRDYSVDAVSDSIFREFSKIDPKYETPPPQPKRSMPNRSAPRFIQRMDTLDVHSTSPRLALAPIRQRSYTDGYTLQ